MDLRSSGCLALFCTFFFLLLAQALAEKKLKFVTVVYRHGDRSPTRTYPKDKYQEDSWPDGFGQLTKIGKQQHYELGKYIKKRYSGFLSPSYKHHEIYVRSTDMDRTLMSAQANLAGLYPPNGEQVWNPNITWQPIPVHTVPLSEDRLLYMPFYNCAYYDQLQNDTFNSEEFHRLVDPYSDFLQTLAQNTGFSAECPGCEWKTYDALYCEHMHNFTLPEWATKETMAKLQYLSEIYLSALYGVHKQHEKSRLQGGVFLEAILKNINVATTSSSKKKLIMYSAHDTTLAALQMALNVSNGKLPPYASCHFFELYELDDGKYTIEMLYRNDSAVEPHRVTLPGCTFSCPLTTFIKLTSSVIVEDWRKECGIVKKYSGTVVGLAVTLTFLGIAVVVLLFLVCRKHVERSRYQTV